MEPPKCTCLAMASLFHTTYTAIPYVVRNMIGFPGS